MLEVSVINALTELYVYMSVLCAGAILSVAARKVIVRFLSTSINSLCRRQRTARRSAALRRVVNKGGTLSVRNWRRSD